MDTNLGSSLVRRQATHASRNAREGTTSLPSGVERRRLQVMPDSRGSFTEIFREEWFDTRVPQWNLLRCEPGSLRGVHVHPRHDDCLTLVSGSLTVGLMDLRPDSPTSGMSVLLEMEGTRPEALTIPHGVAHGFYAKEPSVVLTGASHYYDPDDELRILWSDPELGLHWPEDPTILSPADRSAPSLAEAQAELRRRQDTVGW